MDTPKRRRNYTAEEKETLLKIIEDYKSVFEDKNIDSHTRNIKKLAWEEIAKKFNKKYNANKTSSQLQFLYKNIKQKMRTLARKEAKKSENSDKKSDVETVNDDEANVTITSYSPGNLTIVKSEINSPNSEKGQEDVEIVLKRKKLDLIQNEIKYKQQLYKIEIEYAMKKNKLLDYEIALKAKKLLENQ